MIAACALAAFVAGTVADVRSERLLWPPPSKFRCALCVEVLRIGASLGGVEGACEGFFDGDARMDCHAEYAAVFGRLATAADVGAVEAACASGGFCEPITAPVEALKTAAAPDVRVVKGFGTKPYDNVRVSVIAPASAPAATLNGAAFDYHGAFQYKWTGNAISSSMVKATDGEVLDINGASLKVTLPRQGDGVAGVLIADPCVASASVTSRVGCLFAKKFQTEARTPALLNLFGGDAETAFWGVLGDNWYDQTGETTASVFAKLSLELKAKLMLTVAGNHDYWIVAPPGTSADQFGNGHMQWYAQDAKAAEGLLPEGANGTAPFDYSVDPSRGHWLFGGNLPQINNGFYYNQIGNLGFIGFSGAYTYAETLPLLKEACAWAGEEASIKVLLLVGHWDVKGMGATKEMDVPGLYDGVKALPGCAAFEAKKTLKFVMGHTHCNVPHPHGHVDTGFMVAGQGMEGCGNYGVPVVDSTAGRFRIHYFPVVARNGTDTYDEVTSCVAAKGWRGCLSMAETWLDQKI
eukprot:TRINITY_DN20813_c0_g1_i1.p1 TRINITY_DN20813_c0_g1~~TRINITY_DN20813_c0_g1_i1.p1  ORF type:complete len:522 (+),score=168.85 TRINITY_DN20813_c0_g1_i1:53-1618(+)